MSRSRRFAAVPLPKHVFKVKGRKGQDYYYFQLNRGKPDHGPLVRLPNYDTPEFWERAKELGSQAPAGRKEKTVDDLIDKYKAAPEWKELQPNSQRLYQFRLDTIALAWGMGMVLALTRDRPDPRGRQ